ncbi:MAG TPA: hypothetical protein VGA78_11125 [Gemmatimonadales bacterium]
MTARANLSIGPGAVRAGVDTHEALRLACLAQEAGVEDRHPEEGAGTSSHTGEAAPSIVAEPQAAPPYRGRVSQ